MYIAVFTKRCQNSRLNSCIVYNMGEFWIVANGLEVKMPEWMVSSFMPVLPFQTYNWLHHDVL